MYIYKLTNLINKKAYVGLTTQLKLEKRIKQHIRDKESVISKAIKKYGFANFLVEVIEELTDLEVLKEKEIYYINYFKTLKPNGYNIITSVQNMNMQRKSRLYEIKDPKGNIHITETLDQFCQQYNLSVDCMYNVARGSSNHHKSWVVTTVDFKPVIVKCRATATAPWENEDYRKMMTAILIKANYEHMELHREIGERVWGSKRLKYEMTTPEGISFCIEGLNRFCKENELDTSNMAKVAQGKAKHYKKWKCVIIN